MRGSWFVARAELRRRWKSVIALTLLVGLVSAIVLTALAGARRTSTAFARFGDETRAADLTVFIPKVDSATMAKVRGLPGVEAIGRARDLVATINGRQQAIGAPLDDSVGRTVWRPRIVTGRRPREDRANEITVPEPLARAQGIALGDWVTLRGFTQEQIDAIINGAQVGKPAGPRVRLHVVALTRVPGDLAIQGSTGGVSFATRRFVRDYGDQMGTFAPFVLLVRLTDEDAARAFVREARRLVAAQGQPGEFQVEPTSETEGAVQQSIDVVSTGLLLFALVVAAAGIVAIGIALRRFVDGASSNLVALRGLGLSRRGRVFALGLPAVPIALGAGVLAVTVAWLASPLMPLGLARRAEPNLGFDVDGWVLGLGFLVVILTVFVVAGLSGRRAVRVATVTASDSGPGTSTAARGAVRAGLAPPVTVGVTMAVERGRGRSAVPVRPALVGAVVAVLGVVAVGVFGASLSHLVGTPAAYGYNWDAHVGGGPSQVTDPAHPCTSVRSALARDRAVAAVAAFCSNSVEVDGHAIGAYGFVPLKGAIAPKVLAGRRPRAADEVALGTETLARVHASVGDRVEIAGPAKTSAYRVVGRVVLPPLGGDSDVNAIADGAILTGAGLEAISGKGDLSSLQFVVRWRPGADLAAARARLRALPDGVGRVQNAVVPLEVERLDQLDALPWILGGCLALIGVLGVGYALVTAIRRRARDFAVLKTIGFCRRQVIGTVATQATVYAVVGLVVGIPLGVVVGRLVWHAVAADAGLAPAAPIPMVLIAAVAAATLIVVNLIALLPARAAARTRPAVVLRSE
jgi:predicted lysophospholipase L1 biosynthesis ABC-type transport system permease subunit